MSCRPSCCDTGTMVAKGVVKMSDTNSSLTYTVEVSEGAWFQLWYDGKDCVYSEDLTAKTRQDAEREAEAIASGSNQLERIMEAMGCISTRPEAGTKG